MDNTCVVSILKNTGTSHNKELNKKCKNIWEWCIQKDIWPVSTYVKSSIKLNKAD